jgi:hypothetical protein
MRWLCVAFCSVVLLTFSAEAQPYFTEHMSTKVELASLSGGSRSLAWGDYNNDGWPDLFCAEGFSPQIALLENEAGEGFSDRTFTIEAELDYSSIGGGISFADIDNDGDLDGFLPKGMFWTSMPGMNVLLRNDGGVLWEGSIEAGLTDILPTDNAIWLDFDRDGWIDLYTGNIGAAFPTDPAPRNRLYRNGGDGHFAPATTAPGLDVGFFPSGAGGGTNGGMAAGDFTGDGWTDIYVGAFSAANRLFVADGELDFSEVTSREINDEGQAFGVATGDIDNDGDIDIFQAAGGGGGDLAFRSLMLVNVGGQFLDVTDGSGLSILGDKNLLGPGLADIDNDGDLDLLISAPTFLFLNNGDGTFQDVTAQSGLESGAFLVVAAFADFDLDGFLDVQLENRTYRNTANDNHWLRVEPVGTASNRQGLGTRVFVRAGELRQLREVTGGTGYAQDEGVAHFGLGKRDRVDSLEIHWPSGQVDLLLDVAVDQKIRVIEGRTQYAAVEPTTWRHDLPDRVVHGTALQLDASVQPALFEIDARVLQVTADLSALGGPQALALTADADGDYQLQAGWQVAAPSGWQVIRILIEQETSLGPRWTSLSKSVEVLPAEAPSAPYLFSTAAGAWHVQTPELLSLTPSTDAMSHEDAPSTEFLGSGPGNLMWITELPLDEPVDIGGYGALRFAFRPGELIMPSWSSPHIALYLNGTSARMKEVGNPGVRLVDLAQQQWQVVEIPLAYFDLQGPLEQISLFSDLRGPFYLADLQLVPEAPITVVHEERVAAGPEDFALGQNYPNPFNSSTTLRFSLPVSAEVDLAVYNAVGQRVTGLARGPREAGTYQLVWDGRDDQGHDLASGVYLYQLRVGARAERKRMLLLR